jgi:hypothetical protein
MKIGPSVFMSHSHADKPFVRRLSVDLGALGAHVWLDEAEIKVGDSLFDKIERAIDEVNYLAVMMSPDSVNSSWVREELRQAMHGQLLRRELKVLPVLLRDCQIPGFLREKLYADFRDESRYEPALEQLALSVGLKIDGTHGSEVRDPFARRFDRVESFYGRPRVWHCVYCGWRCDLSYDNYICHQCKGIRPFFAPGATMRQCLGCRQWSIGIAAFCEWCGASFKTAV